MASIFDMGLNLPSTFKDQQNQAQQQYQAKLAQLAAQEGSTALNFGFKFNRDPGGSLTDFQIDPTLMHSQAMDLLQSHAQNLGTLRNQLAGQHLGRTGLAKQRELLIRYLNGGDTQNLANSFQTQLAGIQGQRGQAAWDMNSSMSAAELAAIQYAMANGLFNPPSGGGGGYTPPQGLINGASGGAFNPIQATQQAGTIAPNLSFVNANAPTGPGVVSNTYGVPARKPAPTGGGRAVAF